MGTMKDPKWERMEPIAAGLPSKSEKIRRLAAAGFSRSEIARFLGVRYQFVYNVLSAPTRRPAGRDDDDLATAAKADETEQQRPMNEARTSACWAWTKVDKHGAVVLPESFRGALGLSAGDDVQIRLTADGVQVLGREAALRALQSDVRRFIPEGVSLVDELISERRAEAAREDANG